MSMVWNVIVSYALINLLAGILDIVRNRKEISQEIDIAMDDLMEKTNSDIFKNDKFVKTITVLGATLVLIYDLLLWAPDNLVRNIIRLRRE